MIAKILNYHPFKPCSSTSDGFRYKLGTGYWMYSYFKLYNVYILVLYNNFYTRNDKTSHE